MASGFISKYWGWPAIFYVNGTLGAIWTAVYVFIGSTSPETSKIISAEEKLYIQTSLGHVGEQKVSRSSDILFLTFTVQPYPPRHFLSILKI